MNIFDNNNMTADAKIVYENKIKIQKKYEKINRKIEMNRITKKSKKKVKKKTGYVRKRIG